MRGVPDTYPAGRCMGRCEVVVVPPRAGARRGVIVKPWLARGRKVALE